MCPPKRFPCRHLWRCLTILADGTATMCGQDFKAAHPIGNAFTESVEDLWNSEKLNQIRQRHQNGEFGVNALCAQCKEWPR